MTHPTKTYFLCGIGGSGVSALARLLLAQGARVRGSDRAYDRGESLEKFSRLEREGVALFPQDGSGVTADVDLLIVSSAVEETVPDVRAARACGVAIRKRAELLADLFNAGRGIGIGGTSGKTTVTAMIGHMLAECGRDPTIVNGGLMLNFPGERGDFPSNCVISEREEADFVAELDESDGSIALFTPDIAVLTNITLDHKPIDELLPLFRNYLGKAKTGCVLNLDDPESVPLKDVHPKTLTFGIENALATLNATDLRPRPDGISFALGDIDVSLVVPGRHNVANALAALAVARLLNLSLEKAAAALSTFKGTRRRLELLGSANEIAVFDDFAHNPDKIAASLSTLKEFSGRVFVIYQPHGYGPTKLLKNSLVYSFLNNMGEDDILLMPEIYYAGGTAEKTVSSRDIIEGVLAGGQQARFFETRDEIIPYIAENARGGDRVIVMGARDDTLSDFAQTILDQLA